MWVAVVNAGSASFGRLDFTELLRLRLNEGHHVDVHVIVRIVVQHIRIGSGVDVDAGRRWLCVRVLGDNGHQLSVGEKPEAGPTLLALALRTVPRLARFRWEKAIECVAVHHELLFAPNADDIEQLTWACARIRCHKIGRMERESWISKCINVAFWHDYVYYYRVSLAMIHSLAMNKVQALRLQLMEMNEFRRSHGVFKLNLFYLLG